MANVDYIRKYDGQDEIIETYYKIRNLDGSLHTMTGIVNPFKVDNRQIAAVADQQGNTPHCAAYSIANLVEAIIWKRTGRLINLEADQIYAKAKLIEGDINVEGTYLECAIKSAIALGGIPESQNVKIGFLYSDGTDKTIETIKYLIHKYDFVHVGFNISTGWYDCNQNNPYVRHTNQSLGGHAVLAVGYDPEGIYIQNSWGKEWGSKSFGVVPWDVFKTEFMYGCFLQNCYDNLHE